MSRVVIDASAVLTVILDEPGTGAMRDALKARAVISAVNLAEICTRLKRSGWPIAKIETAFEQLEVEVIPFGRTTALASGDLWPTTRALGLGLGDRSCLALAQELGLPAVTADRAWARLDLPGVEVHLIR